MFIIDSVDVTALHTRSSKAECNPTQCYHVVLGSVHPLRLDRC